MRENTKRQLELLKEDIEAAIGHEIRTPKDYDMLSETIFKQTNENIGRSTLMRLWGYVKSNSQPSRNTLDVLAHFLGYANWETYQQTHEVTEETSSLTTGNTPPHKVATRLVDCPRHAHCDMVGIPGIS